MRNDKAKSVIVGVLQTALKNSNPNPQHIADAIIQKIQFETSLGEAVNIEVIQTIIESVEACKKEMDEEFEKLNPKEDTLLRNFIRGKSHAYQEMLDILNKL